MSEQSEMRVESQMRLMVILVLTMMAGCTSRYIDQLNALEGEQKRLFDLYSPWLEVRERIKYADMERPEDRAAYAEGLDLCQRVQLYDQKDRETLHKFRSGFAYLEGNKHLLRRECYLKGHPDVPQNIREAIAEGALMLGMTKEFVTASWGSPERVHRTVSGFGTKEQWIYQVGRESRFLYFDDGKLTAWQD